MKKIMAISVELDKSQRMLIIKLPLEKPRPSASGKTTLIASSRGLTTGSAKYGGRPVVVVASAFVYPDQQAKPTKQTPKKRSRSGSVLEFDVHHPCEGEQPKYEEEEED
jgi:hypothetical protein